MEEEIYDTFNNDKGFIKDNGYKLIELDKDHAKMECIVTKKGLNPMDIAHGGLLFGLADTVAGALASMSGKFPLTTSSTINYLNPVKEGKIYAISKVLKQGNKLGFYESNIYDENDLLLCEATVTMYFVKKK